MCKLPQVLHTLQHSLLVHSGPCARHLVLPLSARVQSCIAAASGVFNSWEDDEDDGVPGLRTAAETFRLSRGCQRAIGSMMIVTPVGEWAAVDCGAAARMYACGFQLPVRKRHSGSNVQKLLQATAQLGVKAVPGAAHVRRAALCTCLMWCSGPPGLQVPAATTHRAMAIVTRASGPTPTLQAGERTTHLCNHSCHAVQSLLPCGAVTAACKSNQPMPYYTSQC